MEGYTSNQNNGQYNGQNVQAAQSMQDGAIEFGATITEDGYEHTPYIPIIEGDYAFNVKSFERGWFEGSAKMGQCPKVILTLQVATDEGLVTVKDTLIMHNGMMWKLAGFFRCIGLKKRNEPVVVDFDKAIGKSGYAHFGQEPFVGRNGETKYTNRVFEYYDYDEANFARGSRVTGTKAAQTAQQVPQQQAVQQAQQPVQAYAAQQMQQPVQAYAPQQAAQQPVQTYATQLGYVPQQTYVPQQQVYAPQQQAADPQVPF